MAGVVGRTRFLRFPGAAAFLEGELSFQLERPRANAAKFRLSEDAGRTP